MKKIALIFLGALILAGGVYFGYFKSKKGDVSQASHEPVADEGKSKDGKEKSKVQKEQERIAQSIADQTAIQQQIQTTNQRSIDEVQRTLRTVEEINRINRQNQQLQQQNRR